ncbi:MAG TPA: helix-turn-helix domain-containing protein [Ornithinibacter sp.]|nr:helix-turn-helix domain-containing protein [Ornithinibacter sp.]
MTSQAGFAAALTDLRLRAGLSVRGVARRSNIPVSTLGGYFSGKHLPPATRPDVLDAVLEALAVPRADHGAWHTAVRRLGRVRFGATAILSPYPGLRAYDEQDAGLFRGRSALTDRLLRLVRQTADAGDGIVVVTGASGAGKSSLLRAGLLPQLSGWSTTVCTPGTDPVMATRAALVTLDPSRAACLVIDQFEEAWTLGASPDQRAELVDLLDGWASNGDQPRVVVAGLRADFYAAAAELSSLHPALQGRQLLVGSMTDAELAEAIREPAIAAGAAIDPGFVDFLVGECRAVGSTRQQTVLPHFNHCLASMWAHRDADRLTVAAYLAVGGLSGAVTETAEEAWASLAPEQHAAARHLLLQLVSVDDELPPAAVESPLARFGPQALDLIRHFADARLLTVDTDTVRLSHEAVIASWPRLQQWLEEDRGLLLQHRMVGREAAAWAASGRDDAFLLRGSRLAAVRDWPTDWYNSLDDDSRRYVDASVTREEELERAQARRTRQLRWILVGTSLVSVIALVASVGYLATNRTLYRERDEARSRQLAVTARTLGETNVPVASHLALSALQTADTVEARSAVVDLTAAPPAARLVGAVGQRTTAAAPQRNLLAVAGARPVVEFFDTSGPTPHKVSEVPAPTADSPDSAIFAMSFSADGDRLALGGDGTRVRVLDVSDPANPRAVGSDLPSEGTVYSVQFAGDDLLLVGTQLGGVARWRLAADGTASALSPLPVEGAVQSLAARPDGSLAAGTDGGKLLVWPGGAVTGAAASPPTSASTVSELGVTSIAAEGEDLLVGSRDRILHRVRLDGAAVDETVELGSFKSWVNAVAVTGDVVVAGSSDSTLGVWRDREDVDGVRLNFPAGVTDVDVVGPTVVVVGLSNGEAHVVNLARTLLYPGQGIAFSTHFSSRSDRLLVAPGTVDRLTVFEVGSDGPASLAVAGNDKPDDRLNGVGVINPEGDLVVAARRSGAVVGTDLTDPANPRTVFDIKVSDAMPEHMAFDSTGRTLLVGGDDNTVRVVDMTAPTPRVTATLEGPTNYVLGVAISPDGSMIAAASLDTHVWLWRRVGDGWGTPTREATGGHAFTVAFHPTQPLLAGSGVDRVVHVWDVGGGDVREVSRLTGPDNDVYQIAFSPQGALAAASLDKTVSVWGAEAVKRAAAAGAEASSPPEFGTADPTAVLRAAGTGMYSASWNRDGSTLAAGGADGVVRIWTISPERATAQTCAAQGDPVTEAEWARLVPDIPFSSPCSG